jgi:uncharacterized membrane protein
MDVVAVLLKIGHVLAAFALIGGLMGRWVLLTRAARAADPESAHLLAETAGPFEKMVQVSGAAIVLLGLVTAWAQGYPWLGLTTPWMLLSVLLILPLVVLVPLIFIPRGRVFETAMEGARAAGTITPELRQAWADPAVTFARRYEIAAVFLIVLLMIAKPGG